MDRKTHEQSPQSAISRRTVMKGAAWSVPVIAAAVAAPAYAAASTDITINPGTPPVPTGVCTPLGTITFTITKNGAPLAGQSVIVTLPPEGPSDRSPFHWDDNTTAPKTFVSNASGVVDLTSHIVTGSDPGTYPVMGQIAPNGATSTIDVMVSGLWYGAGTGHSGSMMHAVYVDQSPSSITGTPDYWAWCVEHDVSAKPGNVGTAGDLGSFLGSNHLTGSSDIYSKVLWIIQNSYPGVSLATFGTNAGVPGISAADAITAVQYAIWRYTDLDFDADWNWDDTTDSEAAYWWLIGQINDGKRGSTDGSMTGKILSVSNGPCSTPTGGDHAQSQILVIPA